MTHKAEIKYWAEHPDGTKVWQYEEMNITPWKLLCCAPEWFHDKKYIVDNEWSELRKAQADGKQLQFNFGEFDDWEDTTLTYYRMATSNPPHWRIKPKKKVYEYQWIVFDTITNEYLFTAHSVDKPIDPAYFINTISKYEPSKRETR